METDERKSMKSANHHSEDIMREISSSTGKKNSSRHGHRRHHRSSNRHTSLKTLDIDRFFFQPRLEKDVEAKETREICLPPGDKESYLHLLSNAEMSQRLITNSKPIISVIKSAETDRKENESPPSKNGTMDEYSVSDLVTSDDSVANVALKRRPGLQHNLNRNFESANKLSPNGYHSKGSHDENMKSKSTKVRERRISKVKNTHNITKESKDNLVTTIEKYLNVCHLNYEQVESQINSTFSNLSNSINYRRKALIEEARIIRDRKINSLNEAKSKFLESKQPVSTLDNSKGHNEHVVSNGDADDTSLSQLDEVTIYKGIYEPWGSGDTSNDVSQKDNDDDESSNSNNIDDSLKPNEPGQLEEGNMTFYFDAKESNFFNKIGSIKENLSSPQCSFTKGLSGVIRIVGDKIDFEVHTRNIKGEVNVNIMDRIVVRVYDSNKKKIAVEATSSHSPYQRSNSFTKQLMLDELKTDPGIYFYSFTPLKSGNHEVLVKLNDVEIATSPFTFPVYTKSDLTFENMAAGKAFDRHCSDSELKYNGSQSSEDANSNSGSDEDTFYPNAPSMLDRDWIVQKGGKSSLLRSFTNVPSNIYATAEVQGMCAWQLRVTSACMNIVLSVGVKTRCGIPDLDEQFTCEFYMGTFVKTATNLDKVNHANQTARRKSSMFTRLSWTFTVLLNDGIVRVTCHELDEDKKVEINLLNSFTLHPFCSMIHHHKGFVSQVCPRPQLTFL